MIRNSNSTRQKQQRNRSDEEPLLSRQDDNDYGSTFLEEELEEERPHLDSSTVLPHRVASSDSSSSEYSQSDMENSLNGDGIDEGNNGPSHNNKKRKNRHTKSNSPKISIYLYISHFLSTWNARVLEFGAVLFLAEMVPNTFLPLSLYALFRSLSAILFSSKLGAYIDTNNRLKVVRHSIVYQRIAVIVSCLFLWGMKLYIDHENSINEDSKDTIPLSHSIGKEQFNNSFGGLSDLYYAINNIVASGHKNKHVVNMKTPQFATLMSGLIACACIERLCATMNMISVERDWVVVISNKNSAALQLLNARMRRIDLFCKLIGPLAISYLDECVDLVVLIWSLLIWNLISMFVEYFTIAKVYYSVGGLQQPKTAALVTHKSSSSSSHPNSNKNNSDGSIRRNKNVVATGGGSGAVLASGDDAPLFYQQSRNEEEDDEEIRAILEQNRRSLQKRKNSSFRFSVPQKIRNSTLYQNLALLFNYIYAHFISPFVFYFSHPLGLASFSLACLYMTVLSFGPQMVSFLLFQGTKPSQIGNLRTISTICELATTFFAPWLMSHTGPSVSGLFFVNFQAICLALGLGFAWSKLGIDPAGALYLVGGVILSRIGLWGFDLSTQVLIQEGVEAHNRAKFSATEVACQSIFELASFMQTIIWSKPEQFKYPAIISVASTITAAILFLTFFIKNYKRFD